MDAAATDSEVGVGRGSEVGKGDNTDKRSTFTTKTTPEMVADSDMSPRNLQALMIQEFAKEPIAPLQPHEGEAARPWQLAAQDIEHARSYWLTAWQVYILCIVSMHTVTKERAAR